MPRKLLNPFGKTTDGMARIQVWVPEEVVNRIRAYFPANGLESFIACQAIKGFDDLITSNKLTYSPADADRVHTFLLRLAAATQALGEGLIVNVQDGTGPARPSPSPASHKSADSGEEPKGRRGTRGRS